MSPSHCNQGLQHFFDRVPSCWLCRPAARFGSNLTCISIGSECIAKGCTGVTCTACLLQENCAGQVQLVIACAIIESAQPVRCGDECVLDLQHGEADESCMCRLAARAHRLHCPVYCLYCCHVTALLHHKSAPFCQHAANTCLQDACPQPVEQHCLECTRVMAHD